MKKRKLLFVAAIVVVVIIISVITVFATADNTDTPTLAIAANSLELKNAVFMNFKVSSENISDTSSIKLLVWEEHPVEYSKDTAPIALSAIRTEDDTGYLVFQYNDLSAKDMTKFVYVCAYANVDGEGVYSKPVKFSIIQYAYNMLTSESTPDELKELLSNMLLYGASAQNYFDYKTNLLATDPIAKIKVVNGTHADGFKTGYYKAGTSVKLTANEAEEGYIFSHWEDSSGNIVGTESTLIISECTSEIYTAIYADVDNTKLLYRYREKIESTTRYPKDSPWTLISQTSSLQLVTEYNGLDPNEVSEIEKEYSFYYYSTNKVKDGTCIKYTTNPHGTGSVYYFDEVLPDYGMYDTNQYTYSKHPVTGIKLYYSDVCNTYTIEIYTKYEYSYWKWSEWSAWSELPHTASETVEVETKESDILYRYRKKIQTTSETILSEPWVLYNTTTAYEHSDFKKVVLKSSDTIDESYCVHNREYVTKYVNEHGNAFYLTSQELIDYISRYPFPTAVYDGSYYRYTYCTSKSPYNVYHYCMWGDWSEWSYTPVVENDNVEVETKVATIITISYDANGGTGAPSPTTKEFDETIILSTIIPSRDNHQFLGWSTSVQGEVEYLAGEEYYANADVTFYAVWKNISEYSVVYNMNGGGGTIPQQTKLHDEVIKISTEIPTREGYSFLGWSTTIAGDVEYESGGIYENNVSIVLFAVWSKNEYIVCYDANGGVDAPSFQIKTYGDDLILSSVKPTREYHMFKGWSATIGGSVEYIDGDIYSIDSDIMLYAVWAPNTYTR